MVGFELTKFVFSISVSSFSVSEDKAPVSLIVSDDDKRVTYIGTKLFTVISTMRTVFKIS